MCVSLFDEKCQHWNKVQDQTAPLSSAQVPNVFELRDTITGYKGTLCISEDKAREIEQGTREQRNSSLWHSVRQYQITSSLFGAVLAGRETTPPDSLVLRIL